MTTLAPLPVYPSAQARKTLSASQLAQFHLNVSHALARVISLPPEKRDTPATRAFVSSYAINAAHQVLQNLIWENAEPLRSDERVLRQRVLMLAERLAGLSPGLDTQTLLDLCVAFSSNTTRLKALLAAELVGTPTLPSVFASDVVPAFAALLRPAHSSGLHSLGKTARCLISLLRPCPPELVRPFAHSKDLIVALARAYDEGLHAIARSYGGIRIDGERRTLDDWERMWLQTKVDLVDTFHVLITTILNDVSAASGTQLAVEADRAFGMMFTLLDIAPQYAQQPSSTSAPLQSPSVPFLNRSLVADYQHAYNLEKTLTSVLRRAARKDAQMARLESTLRSFDVKSSSADGSKEPGALKLLLRSSGTPFTSSRKPTSSTPVSVNKAKGKAKAIVPDSTAQDPDLDLKVTQVLDIFPDQSPDYLRKLLTHPSFPFRGSAEKVIEALLEGNAPDEGALLEGFMEDSADIEYASQVQSDAPIERRNIFDDQVMDLERVRYGKKRQEETISITDQAEAARMKADILRRMEAMYIDPDDEEDGGQNKSSDVIYPDDDFDVNGSSVKVAGDGETSEDEHAGEEGRPEPTPPETILELAYLRDPNLFQRDAETRRSKARTELKAQTGWSDEQIEGWKIMLERNPKKDVILQKHEFSGNRAIEQPATASGSGTGHSRGGGYGRGARGARGRGGARGRARGGDRGRGRGGAPTQSRDEITRGRAFKDKHKASNANHDRKRGHDKKMARAGAGPSG